MTTNNTKKTNTIGCDNLIDNAFVPENTQAHQYNRTDDIRRAAREDAGIAPALSWADMFDDDFSVNEKYRGVPEEGVHMVKFDGEPVVRSGRNNSKYMAIDLVETKTGCCWTVNVNQENLKDTLNAINYNNTNLLKGLNPTQMLYKLIETEFTCWTLQTEKGTTATYFDAIKYSKRLYVMELNHEKEMQKREREKNRLDKEARMAEEAKMGRENKSPWEE